jgi:DNA-binding GntR family transcriptional regulator
MKYAAKDTFTDKVYNGIKRDIANGFVDLNEFIVEQAVADRYGVSKGTAGEALHRLCMGGDLISYPRKGYLVKVYNDIEHAQIQRLRYTVESLVIRLLVQTKTDGELQELARRLGERPADRSVYFTENAWFHLTLAESAGDRFIWDALANLVGALTHTRTYNSVVKLPEANMQCHRSIVESVCRRDAEAAIRHLKSDLQIPEDAGIPL